MLPTLWFRNTWSWGRSGEGYWPKPRIARDGATRVRRRARDARARSSLRRPRPTAPPQLLFTENETNVERLFGAPNATPYVKDAFHEYVVARPRGRGESRRTSAPRRRRTTRSTIPAGGDGRRCACGSSPRTRRRAQPFGADVRRDLRRRAAARPTRSTPTRIPPTRRRRRAPRRAPGATRGCCGRSSSTTTSCSDWLDGDPGAAAAAAERAGAAATATGGTSTTAT